MEIDDNLGCGLIEIKLPDTAHLINDMGETIFKYCLNQDDITGKVNEIVEFGNDCFKIYSRMDGKGYTLYLAKNQPNYLAVYIKKEKVEYFQSEASAFTKHLLKNYLK